MSLRVDGNTGSTGTGHEADTDSAGGFLRQLNEAKPDGNTGSGDSGGGSPGKPIGGGSSVGSGNSTPLYTGIPNAPPVDVSGLYGSSGKDIVSKLENEGHLKFEGPNADKLRDTLIAALDKSSTFKRLYLDGFAKKPEESITYEFDDKPENINASTGAGFVTVGAGNLTGDPQHFEAVVAHESLHASTQVSDSVAIQQEMTSFFDEANGHKDGDKENGNFRTGDLNYDLLQATREDWEGAGALEQNSSYNENKSPTQQKALESVMGHPGPYSNEDVQKAYTNSCQGFADSPHKIFQAYLDAKDGGKVEKIRAKQLEALGYDPEALKKDPGKAREAFHDHDLNEIASAYHDFFTADDGKQMKGRQVLLTDKIQQAYGALVDDYMAAHPGASRDTAAKAVMDEVKARTAATFPTGELTPDGKDNTIVDQHDNGAYVKDILGNWFDKHGGKDYIKADA